MLAKFQLSNQHLSHLSQPLQYIPVMNTTQGWKPNNSNDGILGTPLPWNYGAGKHKMISKLATQSFHILRLIARNPNFLRQKYRILIFRDYRNSRDCRDSRETLKYGTFGRKKLGFRAMSQRIWKLCVASLLIILCFPY